MHNASSDAFKVAGLHKRNAKQRRRRRQRQRQRQKNPTAAASSEKPFCWTHMPHTLKVNKLTPRQGATSEANKLCLKAKAKSTQKSASDHALIPQKTQ